MNGFIINGLHILYRLKTKYFTASRLGEIFKFILWKDLKLGQGIRIIHKQSHNVFKDYSLKNISSETLKQRYIWENSTWSFQDDIVYEIKKEAYIEPTQSLAFIKPNIFITQSRSRVHNHVVPKLKYIVYGQNNKDFVVIPQLLHFDGYAGRNLYHFIDDALNPLLLAIKSGTVPDNIPVLVHERIYEMPYFQYFKRLPSLRKCNWLVQKQNEWIKTDLIFKGSSSHVYWKTLYEELATITSKKPHRRVFLNRKPQYQRVIKNIDEISSILRKHNFETIYAEDLAYEEQVNLFSEVKYLVAIHGAGITNLLHSEVPKVGLLELFSQSLLNPHFYWVFEQIGLGYYDGVVGSVFDLNWNYTIEEKEFESSLEKMLAAEF